MPATKNRKIKKEIFLWLRSDLKIILKLLNIRFKDFTNLLGVPRPSLYNVLRNEKALNGRWVLSIFTAINYIFAERALNGKSHTRENELALKLIEPIAYYMTHINEIYED